MTLIQKLSKATEGSRYGVHQTTIQRVRSKKRWLVLPGWRDISEAPKDGKKFEAWHHGRRVPGVYWSDVEDTWCTDGLYGPEEPSPLSRPAPTHFIPLSDIPTPEDGE